MRVNRRFLYWGVFLLAIGVVLVAVDLGIIDPATIVDALRLWPLAVVAVGIGLVLRRTRFSLPGGMLAAAAPGLLLGAGFAVAPHFALDCGAAGTDSATSTAVSREGEFAGPARVSVTTGCGHLVVHTASGAGWQFQAGDSGTRAPIIDASARALSIHTARPGSWHFSFGVGRDDDRPAFDAARDDWRVTLPTTAIDDLSLVVNAGQGEIDLPGARIGHLDVTTNAGQTTVDLTDGSAASLTGTVNAGMLSVSLPATTDAVASVKVNAGALQVCVPAGLGLSVHHTGALSGFSVDGVHQPGSEWQSDGYASAAHHADLNVKVNLGNVEIDPIGGCK